MTNVVARGRDVDNEIAGRKVSGVFGRLDQFLVESAQDGVGFGATFFNALVIAAVDTTINQYAEAVDHGFNDFFGLGGGCFICMELGGQGSFFLHHICRRLRKSVA